MGEGDLGKAMRFEKTSPVGCTARELFDWHGRRGAFVRLSPPWEKMTLLHEGEGLQVGRRVELKVKTPLGSQRWVAEHVECEEGVGFVDTAVKSPFKRWRHRHHFQHVTDRSCLVKDEVEYALPFGGIGRGLGKGFVERKLNRLFEYRHRITQEDLRFRAELPGFRKLRILVSGGSGFLGTQLVALLRTQGHEVLVLTRSPEEQTDVRWNPAKGEIELSRLEGLDAVIHLAGENLTSGRWTKERKRRIWESRVDATHFLVDGLLRLERKPSVLLSGSAVGFYGDRPEGEVDESTKRGEGFLAELCEAWEAAALRAESFGCRVVLLRTGIVIDPRGGALAKMLPAFCFGVGGPLGSGRQWFPWIGLEDWIRGVVWSLFSVKVRGSMNLVSPGVARQGEFARSLGKRLGRPSVVPAPGFALKAVFGQMAEEALLTGAKARPRVLEESGYRFLLPSLDEALAFCLE